MIVGMAFRTTLVETKVAGAPGSDRRYKLLRRRRFSRHEIGATSEYGRRQWRRGPRPCRSRRYRSRRCSKRRDGQSRLQCRIRALG